MPDPMDITGRRFGHLTTLKFDSRNRHGQARWRCQCDCGHQAVVYSHDLMSGRVNFCSWCRELDDNARAKEREVKHPVIPLLPTETQVQRMLRHVRERDAAKQQELEDMRAAVRRGEIPPAPQIIKTKSPRHG